MPPIPPYPMNTIKQALLDRDPIYEMELATKAYVDRAIDAIALVVALGRLYEPMTATDGIVALENAQPGTQYGSTIKIDQELMTVTDASDPNNLVVTRGASGSTATAHTVGTLVVPVIVP